MTVIAEREPGRQAVGIALVLLSTVAFAVGPTGAKLALENGGNTITVVALRGVIGAALMVPLLTLSSGGFAIARRALGWCAWSGGFYAAMIYAFIDAVGRIPVGVAVLIFFLHPLMIAVVAHWRGGDRLTPTKLGLALAVLAGLALVLGPGADALDPLGVLLALIAAVALAGMILTSARAQAYASSTQVNFYVTTGASLAYALLATGVAGWHLPVNGLGWLGVAAAGAGIGIGLLAFFASLRHLSPVRATMLSTVEPLLSVVVAAAVLGEHLTPSRWAGVALVIAALVLFEAAGRRVDVGGS